MVGLLALVGALSVSSVAWADNGKGDDAHGPHGGVTVSETLTSNAYTAGTTYTDSAGNSYRQGDVYTGTAAGTINGTFSLRTNVFVPAGSTTSFFDGNFVISDGAGNIVFGFYAGRRVPNGTGAWTDSGRFVVTGGLGTHLGARVSGTFSGPVTAGGSQITWTLTGTTTAGHGKAIGHNGDNDNQGDDQGD